MRLLHTSKLELEEFLEGEIPRYAILSHRWEEEEITFQDLQERTKERHVRKRGWSKIQGCCTKGARDGFKWVWIDSCCIDKSSSAELSEAINSMFTWYRQAQVCYAYLSDVPSTEDWVTHHEVGSAFRCSEWFTRGWTLQELLAPANLSFFNRDWGFLGTKASLAVLVSAITGIRNVANFEDASVSQKMCWASRRETTRIEDRAYSLMGLFGVHMAPLYGEGPKAFLRLQLEILRISDDETIFAWQESRDVGGGLLAYSPAAFQSSGDIYRREWDYDRLPYSMTNKGLRLEAPVLFSADPSSLMAHKGERESVLVPLQCVRKTKAMLGEEILAVRLRNLRGGRYARIDSGQLVTLDTNQRREIMSKAIHSGRSQPTQTFYIKQREYSASPFQGPYMFIVPTSSLRQSDFSVSARYISSLRGQWEKSTVDGDSGENLRVDTLPVEGEDMAAALMFQRNEEERPGRLAHALTAIKRQLRVEKEISDWFIMVIRIRENCAGLDFLTPRRIKLWSQSLTETWTLKQIMLEFSSRFDRIFGSEACQPLNSGQYIIASSSKESDEAGFQRYRVDITISDDGPPFWFVT